MTSSDAAAGTGSKTMFTWRSPDGGRLEQVRLKTSGGRLRANGRIIAAATDDVEAYSVSYELVTNDIGVTRRFSVRVRRGDGDGQLEVSRDLDGKWMVQTPDTIVHSEFGGAETLDVLDSPFFTTLAVNRFKLLGGGTAADVPVVRLTFPTSTIEPVTADYTVDGDRLTVVTGGVTHELTLDDDGLVVEYPGYATRI
ncbi:hypothetical protein nbrc107696_07490 [Gordonia spumicola]|uniref:Glycolipid-binding domain-containing protein n=1 Tax=Gordonia spumicola TaxID=589161 RepID=A0A7I9V532_9ACTN|nr:putative glycolipid-binding domain-containing protein [Gordonia spumicola]GEE00303.1 hypothetical protein nbrc107696_07490 [Gordonia spumicola]